jgi:hypothetical protein
MAGQKLDRERLDLDIRKMTQILFKKATKVFPGY